MADATEEMTVGKKLLDIFSEGVDIFYEIEDSVPAQDKTKKCVGLFEDATRLVSLTGMFSSNETVDEISTENLQFLLLPYFLGQLTAKLQSAERENALKTSEVYYKDFLNRCESYELIKNSNTTNKVVETAQTDDDKLRELLNAANNRNSKIEQYRKMKELEEQISQLKIAVKNQNVDDEIKRDLYLKQINYSILKSKEELNSIEQELQILSYRKQMMENSNESNGSESNQPNKSHNNHRNHLHHPRPALRPVIITKDVAQKAVFGMGYPSLPVMTVSEFYEDRVREGIFPNAEKVVQMNKAMMERQSDEINEEKEELDKAEQDRLEELDDEENIERLRARDEYKDVVRRGDGNRYNRS